MIFTPLAEVHEGTEPDQCTDACCDAAVERPEEPAQVDDLRRLPRHRCELGRRNPVLLNPAGPRPSTGWQIRSGSAV
ncbi:MAG: hypothetical protein V3T83_12260 [Acidobacteriota bacterium]